MFTLYIVFCYPGLWSRTRVWDFYTFKKNKTLTVGKVWQEKARRRIAVCGYVYIDILMALTTVSIYYSLSPYIFSAIVLCFFTYYIFCWGVWVENKAILWIVKWLKFLILK